jgi:hypothetical protein
VLWPRIANALHGRDVSCAAQLHRNHTHAFTHTLSPRRLSNGLKNQTPTHLQPAPSITSLRALESDSRLPQSLPRVHITLMQPCSACCSVSVLACVRLVLSPFVYTRRPCTTAMQSCYWVFTGSHFAHARLLRKTHKRGAALTLHIYIYALVQAYPCARCSQSPRLRWHACTHTHSCRCHDAPRICLARWW